MFKNKKKNFGKNFQTKFKIKKFRQAECFSHPVFLIYSFYIILKKVGNILLVSLYSAIIHRSSVGHSGSQFIYITKSGYSYFICFNFSVGYLTSGHLWWPLLMLSNRHFFFLMIIIANYLSLFCFLFQSTGIDATKKKWNNGKYWFSKKFIIKQSIKIFIRIVISKGKFTS